MAVQSIKSREAQHYPDLNLPDNTEIDSEDDKGGGWLISFVDLLTLLLTLFVLLLAFNQISQSDTPRHITTPTAAPIAAITHHDTTPLPPPQQTPEPTAKPLPKLTIPQDIKDKVDIIATSSEVNLIIKDDVLFDEGSPKLKTIIRCPWKATPTTSPSIPHNSLPTGSCPPFALPPSPDTSSTTVSPSIASAPSVTRIPIPSRTTTVKKAAPVIAAYRWSCMSMSRLTSLKRAWQNPAMTPAHPCKPLSENNRISLT
jgi:hypothetical protein